MEQDLASIGVIGLGKMGLPMAKHLVARGYQVVGFDPDPMQVAAAVSAGVEAAKDVRDVGNRTDGALVIVGFDDQALDVCTGDEGLMAATSRCREIIMCSTIKPETSVAIGQALAGTGQRYADATMCRAEHAAVDATLLILFGGDQQLLDHWSTVFSAFATDVVRVGDVGTGQIAKMINNVLLWITVIGNQEALRFAQSLGVDQAAMVQALLLSSGSNWALETWQKSRPMPWADDDLSICLEIAGQVQFPMPLTAGVRELMKEVKRDKAARAPGGSAASMHDYLEAILPGGASTDEK